MFLLVGAWRHVPVYESFVEGAREGFGVARDLLPYLVAMLCVVGVLRASGTLDLGLNGLRALVAWIGWDDRFVEAMPTALIKPFSGSGARAMLIETMQTHAVDSFPALLAATIQGSTENTFYVFAVYFGAVGIQRARHAVGCALAADVAGVLAAIGVCYWFFGALVHKKLARRNSPSPHFFRTQRPLPAPISASPGRSSDSWRQSVHALH